MAMSAPLSPILEEKDDPEDARIMLGVLHAVEAGEFKSQRHLAAELGIALGLVNAYVKRCVRKGLMKVSEVPARRYAYYLTPTGFAEKSRLTAEYLSYSFTFFRRARADYGEFLLEAKRRGWNAVAFVGLSELAEVAALCALEVEIRAVGIVDPSAGASRFVGLPIFRDFSAMPELPHGAVVTSIVDPNGAQRLAIAALGTDRVLAPSLVGRRKEAGHA